jgi:ribosomal protein S20
VEALFCLDFSLVRFFSSRKRNEQTENRENQNSLTGRQSRVRGLFKQKMDSVPISGVFKQAKTISSII